MGGKLDLRRHGVEAPVEVIGLTLREAPTGPGFLPPAADIFLSYEPRPAAQLARAGGWRPTEQGYPLVSDPTQVPDKARNALQTVATRPGPHARSAGRLEYSAQLGERVSFTQPPTSRPVTPGVLPRPRTGQKSCSHRCRWALWKAARARRDQALRAELETIRDRAMAALAKLERS